MPPAYPPYPVAVKSFLRPGNYVLLNVRDAGIGMDKKTAERVFDRFFSIPDEAR
jgi:signal transduction histidine kinase